MKKLIPILFVLSVFILLIYASSENRRELDHSSNKNSLPQPLPLRSTPELMRLRTCAGDEFNCNLLDEDYTKCVKKYKICNQEIKCSNEDQLECPLCDRNYFYCDQMNVNNKCIQLKTICFNSNELTQCSSNQTIVKNVCESFKLSKPNIPTTTISYDNITVTTTDNDLTENTDYYQSNKTTTDLPLIRTTATTTEINLTTGDSTNSSSSFTTQLYNTTIPSLREPTETTTNSIDELTTTDLSNKSTTTKKSSSSTISSSSSFSTSTKKPGHAPKNILDYSKLFKQDYGGFNFSKFIYKGNKKKGKFNYQNFMNGKKGDGNNSSNTNFFDYSKFMGGNMSKGGSSDYSKYMNGMFDYSKFMGNQKSDKNDMMNYSKYMNQFSGSNGNGFNNYSQFMNNGPKSKEWGSENYDYSKYKQSGLNSSKSSGTNYSNDMKSGQKNQDKFAKNYFNFDGNQQNQPNNLEQTESKKPAFEPNLQNENNVNKPQSNMFDYSKYINQYSAGKTNNFFDYSKYMNQGGQKPNLKNSNLINLTGSRQPTRSFSSYFDYSKWLKPGGHQQVDEIESNKKLSEPKIVQKPKHVHSAGYLKNFSKKIIKFNEDRANQVSKQSESKINENQMDNLIDSSSFNKLKFGEQDSQQLMEPILKETESNNNQFKDNLNLEKEESNPPNSQNEGYHHIEVQNQIPKYNAKQPTVNVSKIIPNMVANKYNYTHYGSGVFFINFGTIVNGNNNINGDGNDVGNGNGNGNNNGNTQGDGMRIPELNNAPKSKDPPKDSSNSELS